MVKKLNLNEIPQVDASLDQPLNDKLPPAIYATDLTPELATASLNLAVDFNKQKQGLANKYLLSHPITLFLVFICVVIYLIGHVELPSTIVAKSIVGFFYQLVLLNTTSFVTASVVLSVSAVVIFTFVCRFSETFFKSKNLEITNTNGEIIYGTDLFAFKSGKVKADMKSYDSKNFSKNTHIIVYRNTPIALISISENKILSNPDSLVMSITTLGCRKVYIPSGILEDLIDWALLRTKEIAQKNRYGESMKVLIDILSFDTVMKEILTRKGFSVIQVGRLQENRILGGLFGVKSELWGVQFRYEAKKI